MARSHLTACLPHAAPALPPGPSSSPSTLLAQELAVALALPQESSVARGRGPTPNPTPSGPLSAQGPKDTHVP